jgi:hypothetical protein
MSRGVAAQELTFGHQWAMGVAAKSDKRPGPVTFLSRRVIPALQTR